MRSGMPHNIFMGDKQPLTATQSATADRAVNKLRYMPQLDGLRAFAVLFVVAHHAVTPYARGGYIGVDIFFVISGYLITTILINEFQNRGTIKLGRFYLRRFIRLYPALIVCAAVVAIPGVILGSSGWLHVKSTVFALLYLTPITRMIDPNSAGVWSHTWSLGIEEMFYLVWPILLLICLRAKVNKLVLLVGTTLIGAGLLYVFLELNGGIAGSFLRAGGIFVGCALALALQFALPRVPQTLGWVALAALVWIAFWGKSLTVGEAVVAVVIASVVLIAVLVDERNSRGMTQMLSHPILTYLGKISYELYLWHYVVLSLGMWAYGREATMMDVAWWAVPLSLALAAGTHALVTPIAAKLRRRYASA